MKGWGVGGISECLTEYNSFVKLIFVSGKLNTQRPSPQEVLKKLKAVSYLENFFCNSSHVVTSVCLLTKTVLLLAEEQKLDH